MLRVVGGYLRGREFGMPAKGARPTANRVREALFNILGQDLSGLRVLDLYAGSGALGIESLSRGARHAQFIEKNPRNAKVIAANLKRLQLTEHATLIVDDVKRQADRVWTERFDLILADPPYAELPEMAFWWKWLSDVLLADGRLVVEHASRDQLDIHQGRPDSVDFEVELLVQRRYGDSRLSVIKKNAIYQEAGA